MTTSQNIFKVTLVTKSCDGYNVTPNSLHPPPSRLISRTLTIASVNVIIKFSAIVDCDASLCENVGAAYTIDAIQYQSPVYQTQCGGIYNTNTERERAQHICNAVTVRHRVPALQQIILPKPHIERK